MTEAGACDECGAEIAGGTDGCHALMASITSRSPDPRRLIVRRTFVDAYALQHPRSQCPWPQDLAAHLLNLCCVYEHGANLDLYSGMKTWLRRARDLEHLPAPEQRGDMTILDVAFRDDFEDYMDGVRKWGRCVWEAWHEHHDTVRGWIEEIRATR